MTVQALPYVVVLGLFYGSTMVVSRFSVGMFHPTTYMGLRLMLSGLAHAVVYALSRRRRWSSDRRLWRHAAVLGVFGTAIPFTAIVSSLQYQSSGISSLLLTTNPALTVLLAHLFLPDEKLNRRVGAGVVLALAGAALLAIRGESGLPDVSGGSRIGYALMLFAMVCSSSMIIYARRFMRDLDAFDVASVRMLVAALTVMPLSAIFFGFDLQMVTGPGYAALGYASLVGTFSGTMLAFYVIKRFGATSSAMTAFVTPIVAGLGGAIFLGETITPIMLAGMVLILSGIATINRRPRLAMPPA